MKLSGHSYNNAVFESLLDGLNKDVVLKKTAAKRPPKVNLNFSEVTENTLKGVQEDELRFIANELSFAAKNAHVEVSGDDLRKFAEYARQNQLWGKELERAARRYCTDIARDGAPPQGAMKAADTMELIHQAKISTVVPAGSPEGEMNHGHKGAFMGMSKNPNSIWDSEAINKLADIPSEHDKKMGDEQIAQSKKAQEEFTKAQKQQEWEEKQAAAAQGEISGAVANVSTVEKSSFNPSTPSNSMSMFNDNREFENILEKTAGEQVKEDAEKRANKKAESKEEWNYIKPAQKADNQRAVEDKFFDGLVGEGS